MPGKDVNGPTAAINSGSREELLDAQRCPADHKNLLVRVCGYSAYIMDLPRELQNEIVRRSLHEMV